jgi:L-seryl-tRNA(Ser) seleniumtransferase
MLTADPRRLDNRARRLVELVPGTKTEPGESAIGGGAFPGVQLATTLVVVEAASADAFLASLRSNDPPVLARAANQHVIFDVRTIGDEEIPMVAQAIQTIRDCV